MCGVCSSGHSSGDRAVCTVVQIHVATGDQALGSALGRAALATPLKVWRPWRGECCEQGQVAGSQRCGGHEARRAQRDYVATKNIHRGVVLKSSLRTARVCIKYLRRVGRK